MVDPFPIQERAPAQETAFLIRGLLLAALFFGRRAGPIFPPPLGPVLFGFLSLDFPTGRIEAILLPAAECDELLAAVGILADLFDLAMAALFALAGGLVFGHYLCRLLVRG